MAGRWDLETLSGDGETLIRDGYRGARLILRTGTRMLPERDPITRGVSRIARKVDETVALAETVALSMLRPRTACEEPAQRLGALAAMAEALPEKEADFARIFVEVHYLLIETILRHWGAQTIYISEHLMRLASRTVLSRHADLIARMRSDRSPGSATVTEFAVASALALIEWHPIRYAVAGDGVPLRPAAAGNCNGACFLAAALAVSGYAGNRESAADPAQYLTSAIEIVEARYDRFDAACSRPDALEVLIGEFDRIIPAMP